ncbi:MAG: hypothetical protein U9R49_14195, partial [Bacteroidota bacterium]|nr:hypothetical protein [Bacteroidota bacterium]
MQTVHGLFYMVYNVITPRVSFKQNLKFLTTYNPYEQFLYSFVRVSQSNDVNLSRYIYMAFIWMAFLPGISGQNLDL